MKIGSRILLIIGCAALLAVSWVVAVTAPSEAEKQAALVEQAAAYMEDGIYIRAVPLLEEAAGYGGDRLDEAETLLKRAYLQLLNQQGYQRKYTELLDAQMHREGAGVEVFREAADFYLERSRPTQAFAVLRDGIAKTGSTELAELYESCRYDYRLGYAIYENVTAASGSTIGVSMDSLWGLAKVDGTLLVPCQYERISTYSKDRMIVERGGEIFAVDSAGNRVALLKERAEGFGNFADDRVPLLIDGQWRRASGEFVIGSTGFEGLGTYSEGYAAAKENGKWGVIDLQNEWLLAPEYDEIIADELGRAFGQGAVFARKNEAVNLYVDSEQVGGPYEDARPFGAEGYAAVKQAGKWGFVDTQGQLCIPCQYDNALSFGQHLAAVEVEGLWGYISLSGELVIPAEFLQVKSFSSGSAPVLTERGWRFITLTEYKEEAGL